MNRQILFTRRPETDPSERDFTEASSPIPTIGPDQVLVRNIWLSVAPYQRLAMAGRYPFAPGFDVGQVMVGETVGHIVASRTAGLSEGDLVLCRGGWQEQALLAADAVERLPSDAGDGRRYLDILGVNGLTAYAGLIDTAKPMLGDTVVVSAAAGSVGSLVGQLARIAGCRTVGIAGGPQKVHVVRHQLGFDACIDYRAPDWADQLRAACPDGIDVYFDNVAGTVLQTVLPLLALGGRVILCGAASQYNAPGPHPGLPHHVLVGRRAVVHGFVVYDHWDRRVAVRRRLEQWLMDGRLTALEEIADGLAAAPALFCRLMRGQTTGKTLVCLGSDMT